MNRVPIRSPYALVNTKQDGNRAAIAQAYTKIRSSLLLTIKNNGIEYPDDLIQEVVISALTTENEIENAEHYLIGAVMLAIKGSHTKQYSRKEAPVSGTEDDADKCWSSFKDPARIERLEKEEQEIKVAFSLDIVDKNLSERDAKILRMFYVKGMTLKDIADEMGLPSQMCRKAKSRAVKKIAPIVKKNYN